MTHEIKIDTGKAVQIARLTMRMEEVEKEIKVNTMPLREEKKEIKKQISQLLGNIAQQEIPLEL